MVPSLLLLLIIIRRVRARLAREGGCVKGIMSRGHNGGGLLTGCGDARTVPLSPTTGGATNGSLPLMSHATDTIATVEEMVTLKGYEKNAWTPSRRLRSMLRAHAPEVMLSRIDDEHPAYQNGRTDWAEQQDVSPAAFDAYHRALAAAMGIDQSSYWDATEQQNFDPDTSWADSQKELGFSGMTIRQAHAVGKAAGLELVANVKATPVRKVRKARRVSEEPSAVTVIAPRKARRVTDDDSLMSRKATPETARVRKARVTALRATSQEEAAEDAYSASLAAADEPSVDEPEPTYSLTAGEIENIITAALVKLGHGA